MVDDEDYPKLSVHKWNVSGRGNKIYARRLPKISDIRNDRPIYMHREIMGNPSYCIDHVNGNGLDNRKSNLRLATVQQNLFNSKKYSGSKSKYKGVSIKSRGRRTYYIARIKYSAKEIYLGCYKNEMDAANAYDVAAIRLFGEFAKTNKG